MKIFIKISLTVIMIMNACYFSFSALVVYGKTSKIVSIEVLGSTKKGKPVVNLVGLPFTNGVLASSRVLSISENKVFLNNLAWYSEAEEGNRFFVEIIEGDNVGAHSNVKAIDVDECSLTLSDKLISKLQEGDKIRIIRHHSLNSIFTPYNLYGFKPGSTAEEADEILLRKSGEWVSYYFSSDVEAWVSSLKPEKDAGDTIVKVHKALLIRRKERTPINLTFSGYPEDYLFSVENETTLGILPNYIIQRSRTGKISKILGELDSAEDPEDLSVYEWDKTNKKLLRKLSKLSAKKLGIESHEKLKIASSSVIISDGDLPETTATDELNSVE